MKLASRGKRLGAYCIDAIIPVFNMILLFTIMGISAAGFGSRIGYGNDFGYGWGNGFGYGNGYGYGYGYGGGQRGAVIAILVVVIMLLSIAYMVVQMLFFAKSKTMGKAALGLQVVSARDGKAIGFGMMLLREWIVKRASADVFYLGYIWMLIDDKNRGWHDKILDTYVVDLKESSMLRNGDAKAAEQETAATAEQGVQEVSSTVEQAVPDAAATMEQAVPATEQLVKKTDSFNAAEKDDSAALPSANAAETKDETAKTVRVDMSLKKDELLAAANEAGAEATDKMTKSEIIEAIEKVTSKE